MKENKETLEEAIKREYEARKFDSVFPFDPQSFALGAEWQAEQDKNKYSEEDMRLSFKAGEVSMNRAILKDEGYDLNSYNLPIVCDFEEWFEILKKK